MRDPWTKKVCATFPNLEGPKLAHCLLVQAIHFFLDISWVEARHATARRYVKKNSTGHAMDYGELDSHWICRQQRQRVLDCEGHVMKKKVNIQRRARMEFYKVGLTASWVLQLGLSWNRRLKKKVWTDREKRKTLPVNFWLEMVGAEMKMRTQMEIVRT